MIPFESFSYPLFDLNYRGDFRSLVKALYSQPYDEMPVPGLKGLYLHIPFCDTICEFCPFNKAVGTPERIARYVEALVKELQTVAQQPRVAAWTLDSVYVGGGTPSVLSESQLSLVLRAVRDNFALAPDAEISVEVEPKSATESKLATLKDAGATRISFGVQTFNPKIRTTANLTATLDQVYETIRLSTGLFDDTNLDLMVGFPGHTIESVTEEMAEAGNCGIGSVSMYPVDYVMTLPGWLERIRAGTIEAPRPLAERTEMFHAARAELARHFVEQNMYCFGSNTAPPTKYMFKTLYGGYGDECLGVGAGAYSFVRGLASYNETVETRYVEEALGGELPVACASPGHAYEKGLVFFPKRMTYDLADLDQVGLQEVYEPRIDALVDQGFVSRSDDRLTLTEAGKGVYSELMVYFFSDQQRRLYNRVCDRLASQNLVIDAAEWTKGHARIRSLGALNAMTKDAARGSRVKIA